MIIPLLLTLVIIWVVVNLFPVIWACALQRSISSTAACIPGIQNTEADFKSRKIELSIEWNVNLLLKQIITKKNITFWEIQGKATL